MILMLGSRSCPSPFISLQLVFAKAGSYVPIVTSGRLKLELGELFLQNILRSEIKSKGDSSSGSQIATFQSNLLPFLSAATSKDILLEDVPRKFYVIWD